MALMLAWYLILMASGQGPTAVGVTTEQVVIGGRNFNNNGTLPTPDNINQEIPRQPRQTSKAAGARSRSHFR